MFLVRSNYFSQVNLYSIVKSSQPQPNDLENAKDLLTCMKRPMYFGGNSAASAAWLPWTNPTIDEINTTLIKVKMRKSNFYECQAWSNTMALGKVFFSFFLDNKEGFTSFLLICHLGKYTVRRVFFQTNICGHCYCFLAEMGRIPCCGRPESSSSNIW